ncbi:hypothetical protein D1AOALGA4SA_12939 [Olavius algarvensis Delta 1 endosymbiont]|nr:hypothetical protein D1AOALGA4SA_12939 [Olavius algarvensis Delta 1 endosymbiont]
MVQGYSILDCGLRIADLLIRCAQSDLTMFQGLRFRVSVFRAAADGHDCSVESKEKL